MIATATSIETQIRDAYHTIAPHAGAWIKLVDLREALGDVNRHAVDAALVKMPDADLMPESNQKVLTGMDRDLAVWCGGEWNHLIRIA